MNASYYFSRPAALELLPAVVFFAVNQVLGIAAATVAVMAATVVAVLVGYVLNLRVPLIAVVT